MRAGRLHYFFIITSFKSYFFNRIKYIHSIRMNRPFKIRARCQRAAWKLMLINFVIVLFITTYAASPGVEAPELVVAVTIIFQPLLLYIVLHVFFPLIKRSRA